MRSPKRQKYSFMTLTVQSGNPLLRGKTAGLCAFGRSLMKGNLPKCQRARNALLEAWQNRISGTACDI
jgi:hypothetical protein